MRSVVVVSGCSAFRSSPLGPSGCLPRLPEASGKVRDGADMTLPSAKKVPVKPWTARGLFALVLLAVGS